MASNIVDVNVTPDKRKVFMDHEKLLIATIKASIRSSPFFPDLGLLRLVT
jgi:DNA mismatch repair ATPase MutL